MKTTLLAVSISLLLCACGPGSSADQSTGGDAPSPEKHAAMPAPPASSTNAASANAQSAADTPPATSASTDSSASTAAADQAVNDAIDSNLGDHTRYQAVIRDLQAAVAADDAARVASLVQYPISADIGGKKTTLKTENDFVARYQELMTPDIRKAIVDTKYGDLFVNYKGVMFGSGQAWINGICKDAKCKEFDVKLVTLQHGAE
jgi:pyruvate/2-oxoglutarate dehydrogenase complex dihydrolipoamide acyltransferase (E2) component